jgi:hypothetical protein
MHNPANSLILLRRIGAVQQLLVDFGGNSTFPITSVNQTLASTWKVDDFHLSILNAVVCGNFLCGVREVWWPLDTLVGAHRKVRAGGASADTNATRNELDAEPTLAKRKTCKGRPAQIALAS